MTKKKTSEGIGTATELPNSNGAAYQPPPIVVTDGPCLRKTLAKIDMPEAALEKVRVQAEELTGEVLATYSKEVATGEVGAGGAARAGHEKLDGFGPTGLMYGKIQSGKTVAMITFAATAIDNGFRVIVVLTTNFLELVRQTRQRFEDLGRVLVFASTEQEEWNHEGEIENIRKRFPDRGLVIICAKHAGHLSAVGTLLEHVKAADYPALILDDEADQASLDNNERKRSRSNKPDEVEATAVHSAIKALRVQLRHHVFLQVTATPYALLLQRASAPLKPSFTFLLEPGEGYTGGGRFFSQKHIEDAGYEGTPPLCFVSETESEQIEDHADQSPRGLERAIAFFLISAAALSLSDPKARRKSQNFLCHTSHKRSDHKKLQDLIVQFISRILDEIDPLTGPTKALMAWAYAELQKTLGEAPPFDELIDDIAERLPRRKIRVVNSDGKTAEPRAAAPNFIIGGNIVGRGLTIPNLLVTYYLRKPKISQMDTMLQHARMFGYRSELMPFTRVFLPRSLAIRFWGIHEAETELRSLLPTLSALNQVPVQVVGNLRATRYGVLDTGSVVTIRSGKHLYPIFPTLKVKDSQTRRIERAAKDIWPGWDPTRIFKPSPVGLDKALELLRCVAAPEWDTDALVAIITSLGRERGTVNVAFRTMTRGLSRTDPERRDLATGALSGEELAEARKSREPTLFLFRQSKKAACWDNMLFYYPTVVFPSKMPNQIYSNSGSENDAT